MDHKPIIELKLTGLDEEQIDKVTQILYDSGCDVREYSPDMGVEDLEPYAQMLAAAVAVVRSAAAFWGAMRARHGTEAADRVGEVVNDLPANSEGHRAVMEWPEGAALGKGFLITEDSPPLEDQRLAYTLMAEFDLDSQPPGTVVVWSAADRRWIAYPPMPQE
ncbi:MULTISPECIES: hypothetical protein [unclassified Streptomyces]|uniref:hypothetical protein n=1 Tax=unclassified Streptomyces TaxID=2593676 RepID=UPI002255A396|nr:MULTISPECIES: hypothetical protein [unclassified Streptomyces]MCX4529923.1 hypothetical protein [Streptomyces sp. NBC_01551]MCX4546701.1 hypothetical protein [Streptomyces sp. NBC_01565]